MNAPLRTPIATGLINEGTFLTWVPKSVSVPLVHALHKQFKVDVWTCPAADCNGIYAGDTDELWCNTDSPFVLAAMNNFAIGWQALARDPRQMGGDRG